MACCMFSVHETVESTFVFDDRMNFHGAAVNWFNHERVSICVWKILAVIPVYLFQVTGMNTEN